MSSWSRLIGLLLGLGISRRGRGSEEKNQFETIVVEGDKER
jgi:hypothetical protein